MNVYMLSHHFLSLLVPLAGFKPSTMDLRVKCSTTVLLGQSQKWMKAYLKLSDQRKIRCKREKKSFRWSYMGLLRMSFCQAFIYLADPSSIVVGHLTHKPKIEDLNPGNGIGRDKIMGKHVDILSRAHTCSSKAFLPFFLPDCTLMWTFYFMQALIYLALA